MGVDQMGSSETALDGDLDANGSDITNVNNLTANSAVVANELGLPQYDDVSNAPQAIGRIVYSTGDGASPEGIYKHDGSSYSKMEGGTGLSNPLTENLDADGHDISNVNALDADQVSIATQLGIPVYSDDSNAPNGTQFFNDSDQVVKYKDGGGTVYSGGSGSEGIFSDDDSDGVYEQSTGDGISVPAAIVDGKRVYIQGTEPESPSEGDIWIDASTSSGDDGGTDSWTTVEDFEGSTPLSGYGGDTGSFTVQSSTVIDGSYTLEATANGYISDMDVATTQGERYRGKVQISGDSHDGFGFLYFQSSESGSNTGYRVRLSDENSAFELIDPDGSQVDSTTFSVSYGTTYLIEFGADGSGNHTCQLYSEDGNTTHATLSGTNTKQTSGGLGFYSFGDGSAFYDTVEKK